MNRRSLLRRTGALAALCLAGCTGDGDGTDRTETPTGSPTATPTPTDTPPPTTTPTPDERRVVASSLTVDGIASGQQTDRVEVTFGTDPATVTVGGTIWGSDGCKTAELGDVAYDAETDTLAVAVATTDREGSDGAACTEAIVEIDYEATVELSGGLPGTVEVTHDGRAVRSVRREGTG